jgi:hypothetical protein
MAASAFVLAGCTSGATGDWWNAQENGPGSYVVLHISLKTDGTATMQLQVDPPSAASVAPTEVNRGTWTQKDAVVTVMWADAYGEPKPRAYTYAKDASGVEVLRQDLGDYYRTEAIAEGHVTASVSTP